MEYVRQARLRWSSANYYYIDLLYLSKNLDKFLCFLLYAEQSGVVCQTDTRFTYVKVDDTFITSGETSFFKLKIVRDRLNQPRKTTVYTTVGGFKAHSRQSAKLFLQSSELGPPQPLSRQRLFPSPQNRGVGAHSPACEGLGESQFRRLEKKIST